MRSRLFIAFTAVILITLISVGFWIQKNTVQEITRFAERGGFFGGDTIADSLENYYLEFGSWDGVAEYIETSESSKFMLLPGKMIPSNNSSQMTGNPSNQQGQQNQPRNNDFAIADSDGNIFFGQAHLESELLSDDQLEFTVPLYIEEEIIGYLIHPGTYLPDRDYINALGENILEASYISFAFAGSLALIFAFVLGYFLTRPINILDKAANKMADGDYSQRVQIAGSPELTSLGETFNNLAESIENHRKSRTAMTADIAHELRTPLAVQRANLEAIQDGIYPLDQDSLSLILEQNNMLTRLVEDLRTLAQSDDDELILTLEDTDISTLISNAVEAFQAQTEKKDIQITFEKQSELPLIPIDIYRFQQVLNNLIQNAISYTPENGRIDISVEKNSENVVMKIIDSGPGIPEESLPHIFNRFYRADSSRSREYGGTGLGLTIAKRFIEAHGGTLTAANAPPSGAEFTISFPL